MDAEVRLMVSDHYYPDNFGSFNVDIIVWAREDYSEIAAFLRQILETDSENKELARVLIVAQMYESINIAKSETTDQLEDTSKELNDLKKDIKKGTANTLVKNEQIADLEERLESLSNTLAQLEEMKTQLGEERKKSELLSQQLVQKEQKEKELLGKISEPPLVPPMLLVASPKSGIKTESKYTSLIGVVEDDKGLQSINFYLNGRALDFDFQSDSKAFEQAQRKRFDFNKQIKLDTGENKIRIQAFDTDGLSTERLIVLNRIEKRRNAWAVVIGINDYPNIPSLKYAVNDARSFYQLMIEENQIPAENVTLLLNNDATLTRMRSTLGTILKKKADKEDMVIIYFAGHGATERDTMSMDGDGLEKYILP